MEETTNATHIAHEEEQVALQKYPLQNTRIQLQHNPVKRFQQGSFSNAQIWRSDLKSRMLTRTKPPDFQCQLANLPNGCWERST